MEQQEIMPNNLFNEVDNIKEKQQEVLSNIFENAITSAVDIGLRTILPDFIEESVIDIKNILMENGLQEGISQIIQNSINIGKSAIGIVTGNFENMEQVSMAIEKGGILDKTSDLLDFVISKAKESKIISKDTSNLIKQGKNVIVDSISNNLEKNIKQQERAIQNLEKYCEAWTKNFEAKDLNKMEKNYEKIKENIDYILPIEEIINKAREIENLHSLIKNKNGDFNISKEEKELSKLLK